jgi:DNA-directed RNA polymerase specialized sigma24 family protein
MSSCLPSARFPSASAMGSGPSFPSTSARTSLYPSFPSTSARTSSCLPIASVMSRHDVVDHWLAMLVPEERRVVILVEIDDLTFREVADRERISPSTAYQRHRRGMAVLRSVEARA